MGVEADLAGRDAADSAITELMLDLSIFTGAFVHGVAQVRRMPLPRPSDWAPVVNVDAGYIRTERGSRFASSLKLWRGTTCLQTVLDAPALTVVAGPNGSGRSTLAVRDGQGRDGGGDGP